MTARRPLKIAPCPCCPTCGADLEIFGPGSKAKIAKILRNGNRRSDAEAERRGAMAAADWIGANAHTYVGWKLASQELREAIERGEVLPAKPEPWIVSKPGKMGGAPCVRGTRIPVTVLQPLAKQFTCLQILDMYPGLTAEGLAAALAYKLPAKRRGARKR